LLDSLLQEIIIQFTKDCTVSANPVHASSIQQTMNPKHNTNLGTKH